MPLLEENHILGFDEIEVSQKDAKCQLAENGWKNSNGL